MGDSCQTDFIHNGKVYTLRSGPIVVVCMDGCSDEYLNAALAHDHMPNLKKAILRGYRGLARAALPTFTNVNNASIVTGASPAEHGICGNFFYDAIRNEEVMMNSATYLRSETILAAAALAGRKVAVVTAKEKLLNMLSKNMGGIGFSAERAKDATLTTHGIENVESLVGLRTPDIYSADASIFVWRAGVALLKNNLADLIYLSLTDYIQHTYPPGAEASLSFYAAQDVELGKLLSLGATVALTADHGMNAKIKADGGPNVIYLKTLLSGKLSDGFRIICPITDPYVKHHGALGSYAVLYLEDKSQAAAIKAFLLQQPGIAEVHEKEEACQLLEQPADRTGDLVILAKRDVVLGKSPDEHNLQALDGPLRSHGGRYEEMVPFIFSQPLTAPYAIKAEQDPRNFDVFDFVFNGMAT